MRKKLLSLLLAVIVSASSAVFVSCGSEADNTAIFSFAKRGNAVTTSGEHSAVYESFCELKKRGVEPQQQKIGIKESVVCAE